jgi:EndoU nuclease-like protein
VRPGLRSIVVLLISTIVGTGHTTTAAAGQSLAIHAYDASPASTTPPTNARINARRAERTATGDPRSSTSLIERFRAAKGADDFVDLASPARRRHILDGEALPGGRYSGGHRAGTGFPGKSEFPRDWSDDKIMHEIADVATDSAAVTRAGRGGDVFVRGTRDGVDIEVLLRRGEIWTGYPTNVRRNP